MKNKEKRFKQKIERKDLNEKIERKDLNQWKIER